MREVAATGDLTRKIALRGGHRWDDEDARLLATTFNTLTDSIARFQREMSQKERLSSLGRLSTVIAHEVRNPLMIIKAALHALRQPDVTRRRRCARRSPTSTTRSARLNRIVNEVLDFARPIRFELAPADLNALCRESAARRPGVGAGRRRSTLDLDAVAAADHDRRRAAADRAGQHAGQRAPRRGRPRLDRRAARVRAGFRPAGTADHAAHRDRTAIASRS